MSHPSPMSVPAVSAQDAPREDPEPFEDAKLQSLLAEPVAAMRKLLLVTRPACTSSALSLLRSHFPNASLADRLAACEAYALRLG